MLSIKRKAVTHCLLSGLMLLGLVDLAHADSVPTKWIGNGHYYQSFDSTLKTWFDAQTACQQQGAHLATVTSAAENAYILTNFVVGNASYTWIGASDSTKEGTYTWVNGEKWNYTNWGSLNSNPDYDYAIFGYGNTWFTGLATDTYAYVCEWSTPNYVDITTVPDINRNLSNEIAVLYVDAITGKHTVKIKDPKSQALLSTLTFLTGYTPPQGVVALSDLNGNKIPEIAVLYNELGQPSVGIKDAKNNVALLKTLRFLDKTYDAKAIALAPDSNANGASEIRVLGISKTTGQAKTETRDSKTGALLGILSF